jgi:hypothetical protein
MTEASHDDRDRLLGRLLGPAGPELTCEECFEQLDRYVELELSQAKADEQIPGMRAHLEGCPACAEDHETLLAFVAKQRDSQEPA